MGVKGNEDTYAHLYTEEAIQKRIIINKNYYEQIAKSHINEVHNLLTIIDIEHYSFINNKGKTKRRYLMVCKCSCNSQKLTKVTYNQLTSNKTKSCGCLLIEHMRNLGKLAVASRNQSIETKRKRVETGKKSHERNIKKRIGQKFNRLEIINIEYCKIGKRYKIYVYLPMPMRKDY